MCGHIESSWRSRTVWSWESMIFICAASLSVQPQWTQLRPVHTNHGFYGPRFVTIVRWCLIKHRKYVCDICICNLWRLSWIVNANEWVRVLSKFSFIHTAVSVEIRPRIPQLGINQSEGEVLLFTLEQDFSLSLNVSCDLAHTVSLSNIFQLYSKKERIDVLCTSSVYIYIALWILSGVAYDRIFFIYIQCIVSVLSVFYHPVVWDIRHYSPPVPAHLIFCRIARDCWISAFAVMQVILDHWAFLSWNLLSLFYSHRQ